MERPIIIHETPIFQRRYYSYPMALFFIIILVLQFMNEKLINIKVKKIYNYNFHNFPDLELAIFIQPPPIIQNIKITPLLS